MLDTDVSKKPKPSKKEVALSQIKSDMKSMYEATADGKYKFLPNKKIVYVTKSQVKRKASKRCHSTDGTNGNSSGTKKKINEFSKIASHVINNAKNRKYINPSTKEVL